MQKVYVMIGIIGSGKSSWAKMKAGSNYMTSIVSKDKIRGMLHGSYYFDELLEPLIEKICQSTIRDLLESGRDIIIDECNITKKERCDLISAIRGLSPGPVEIISVFCSEMKDNLRLMGKKGIDEYIWEMVYQEMKEKFEWPMPIQEGFDKSITIRRD